MDAPYESTLEKEEFRNNRLVSALQREKMARYVSITAMDSYARSSFEELRFGPE